jgi:uncharacterized membrane protein
MIEGHANTRLDAFSDGVFAIAITLLVLELRVPEIPTENTSELWRAISHLGPTLFAFVLSFTIILITWVNHRAALRLVRGTSAPFLYANGAMLLTVALMPFPTALLGRFLLSDAAAPAVVLYDVVLGLQALAWILLTASALRGHLAASERAAAILRVSRRHAYGAVVLYGLLAMVAVWFPLPVAFVTTASWLIWLYRSVNATEN